MNLKHKIIAGAGLLFSVVLLCFIFFPDKGTIPYQFAEVQMGRFEILVTTTGELEAERSMEIRGPSMLQSHYIRLERVQIQDLIAEGSIVKKGDWVATLDRTEAELSLADMEDRVQVAQGQYTKAQLDTSIRMRSLRDQIVNQTHTVEEMKLILEQSAYEPPATIRQAEINLERARRNLRQSTENYVLIQQDAAARVRESQMNLERWIRRYEVLTDLMDQFVITAPADGMVVYHREWNGQKRKVGSSINARDLVVARIPEFSALASRTFVSELDVDRVAPGQRVRIGIDAYPAREFTGRVVDVANVGVEMPNTVVKGFEVLIKVDQNDDIMKPAMTTSNAIITGQYDDVLFIPVAALQQADDYYYVNKTDGTRQIVTVGPFNENFVVIERGLAAGDRVLLEVPENPEKFRVMGQELLAGAGD